ncbi:MAG: GntR family transcriptional regulator [Hyphomicrobiaceae bacterium]|jgi:DNA-binding GntR family transcriptional regulator
MAAVSSSPDDDREWTLGRRVHSELRAWLMSGRLSPGDKVSLRSVADELGVSMQPVRDAVARLVAEEALEVLPNRAVRVPRMTLARFREITLIRLKIEGFAAETAALAHDGKDMAAVRRHATAFAAQCAATVPDTSVAVAENQSLHFAVYRAAKLGTLIPIIEGLWLRVGPILNLDMRASPARLADGGAARCHRDLVAAIERRDGVAARSALEADIEGAAAFIERQGGLPGA